MDVQTYMRTYIYRYRMMYKKDDGWIFLIIMEPKKILIIIICNTPTMMMNTDLSLFLLLDDEENRESHTKTSRSPRNSSILFLFSYFLFLTIYVNEKLK